MITNFNISNSFEEYISYYEIKIVPINYEFRKNTYLQEQKRIILYNNANKGLYEIINTFTILNTDEKTIL